MKTLLFSAALFLGLSVGASAQIQNAKTVTAKVAGNCGMCKKTIEKASNQKDVAMVSWNKDTDIATITFDEKKTTEDALLKKIAATGYDNERYRATDKAYAKLHECCQYDRMKETEMDSE